MTDRAKKHHYNPAFFLAGFTKAGIQKDRLWVFDQEQFRQWQSNPRNAGCQNGFYDIQLEGSITPDAFESQVLAPLDAMFCDVIRRMVGEQRMPSGEEFNILLNFVALMATRTPRIRRLVTTVTSLQIRSLVESIIATDEGWERFRKSYCDASVQTDDEFAKGLREFISAGEYSIDLDKTSHVQKIVELASAMLPLLGERRWSLGIAAEGTPDLVCSDAPVSLVPTDQSSENQPIHITSRETLLIIPLTRRAILMGDYEDRPPVFRVNDFGVLSFNSLTITEAKQVFSSEEEFVYLGVDKTPKYRSDLERSLRRSAGAPNNMDATLKRWLRTRPV